MNNTQATPGIVRLKFTGCLKTHLKKKICASPFTIGIKNDNFIHY